jgi:hypothetical protein
LPAATLIYYRGYATNAGGTVYTSDGSFTTGNALAFSSDADTTVTAASAIVMPTLTINVGGSTAVTAANDIRIAIATSTVHLLWDTADTTAVFGGTAAAKVENPVAYEGGGSVLVIPVLTDFTANETLTVSGLSFTASATNAAAPAFALYAGGPSDVAADSLADLAAGQVANKLANGGVTNTELFAFGLSRAVQNISVAGIVFRLSGINGIQAADLTNMKLYADTNASGAYDAGDSVAVGSGSVALTGQAGTITFTTPFTVEAGQNYFLIGDIGNVSTGDSVTVSLAVADVTATGVATSATVAEFGTATAVQHIRTGQDSTAGAVGDVSVNTTTRTGGRSSSGSSGSIIVDTSSAGTITGSNGSITIGSEPGFNAPTSAGAPYAAWTSGASALSSDGVYATTQSPGAQQSYGAFNFSVPQNNTITGVTVKVEASGVAAGGTVSAKLSWDGGSSVTAAKTTSAFSATDDVYTLGGQSDTWGRTWAPTDFNNGSLVLELIGNPSDNTVQVDAVQVAVYYQASGGGAGGGGLILGDGARYLASVLSGVDSALGLAVEGLNRLWDWVIWWR